MERVERSQRAGAGDDGPDPCYIRAVTREFHDYDQLLRDLRTTVPLRSPRNIGVEGFMSAGKSCLAKRLAADLCCGLVETDKSSIKQLYPDRFAEDNEDNKDQPYLECLDLAVLAERLADELDHHSFVIVEGICLRDTLVRVGRSADLFVYVKRVSRNSGLWHDSFHIEDYEEDPTTSPNGLHRDELEYHARVRPHEHADFVWFRVE